LSDDRTITGGREAFGDFSTSSLEHG